MRMGKIAKVTSSRQRWILTQLRKGAYIKEIRDAYMERSTYELRLQEETANYRGYLILAEISERVIEEMEAAGLICMGDKVHEVWNKRRDRHITNEVYYYLSGDERCME